MHTRFLPAVALAGLISVHAAEWGPLKENMNFLEHDIIGPWDKPPLSDSPDGCYPLCEADERCSGFTWNNGECWLKYGNPELVPEEGSRSAAIKPSQCLPFERDVDYWGNDIECIGGINTPDACCAACTANPDCKVYVVDNNHCCIKTAADDRRPNQDPALNIRAGFVRGYGDAPGVPVVDGGYTVDPRTQEVKFSTVSGAQWLSGIQFESFNGKTELENIVQEVNKTVESHAHAAPPNIKSFKASDGATVDGYWSVDSAGECASIVSMHGGTIFTYSDSSKMCLAHTYPGDSGNPTMFLSGTGSFTSVPQSLPEVYALDGFQSGSKAACQNSCKTRAFCAAAKFSNNWCSLFAPAQGKRGNGALDSVAGWVTSPFKLKLKPNLPAYNNKPKTVRLYTTAHQDDHELFMSNSYHAGILNKDTKTVFVYTSAGDAGQGQKWRLARQLGTVAATKAWVDNAGIYSSKEKREVVEIEGHHITRVSIGNVVHYFLCIREEPGKDEDGVDQWGLMDLLYNGQQVPPMDLPQEVYEDRDAFRAVVAAIFHREADGIAKVEIHAQDQNNGPGDHFLHLATGNLVEEIVAGTKWAKCAFQQYYYDYDVFGWDVNLDSPVYELQRFAWMSQSKAILDFWGDQNWSVHSRDLGRTYAHRTIPASTATCN